MARSIILCNVLLALGHVDATLVSNPEGSPQDFIKATGVDVCAKRSSICQVYLDVPSVCAAPKSPCPALFCLHGHGGHNKQYIKSCGPQIHAHGFIGIYPQGDERGGKPGWADGDKVFIEAMIKVLRATGSAGNFYSFGQSNGAGFTQQLGVNAGTALPIKGIASQSGQLRSDKEGQPQPGLPHVAQLAIHGTADNCVPYGHGRLGCPGAHAYLPELESNKLWAAHNGCKGPLTQKNVSADFIDKKHDRKVIHGVSTHYVYGGCPLAAPVELYATQGAGHVSTTVLDGQGVFNVMVLFFKRVEAALATETSIASGVPGAILV